VTVKITDESSGETWNVRVPDHMADDIIRPLWRERVAVQGIKVGAKELELDDIEALTD
jgi:hypothetical protein